ncbi:ABC transporter substrate-binding protein [Bradyrhizobium sp. AUGA SZCCT0283]|uniref:ABC transporter substrate-binding protein n=1 Tax=Bradyrhizobium sp. AUGA SZCCT0283 TaxID=2807671 RepID=UPI001BA461E6|nr:ABC transporter substrate-binding protein [Bradyrhizobium sp. AUGA SZCCT0283]MBR1273300.1 ABC transporter substrate-binding protein [Bradyrhizobium sp. AUGA SZCCT0283]
MQTVTNKPVNVAVVTYLSGRAAAPFGFPARNAAELMVEAINTGDELPEPYASRGFAGRKLSLRVYDESGSENDQVEQLRRIHADGADIVVGYAGSAIAMAIAPIAEELRLLTVISGGGASQLFARRWDWVFRTQTTTTTDAVGAARYVAAQLGICGLSFGGINQQYLWGTDSWREFRAALQVLQPDAQEVGGHFAPLYSGAVETPAKFLKENGVQLVHSGNWGYDLFRLVEVTRKAIPDARLLLVSGESGLHRLAGTIPDGTIVGGRGSHGLLAHDTELNRWFNASYRDRYEIAPIYPSYGIANALLGLKTAWDQAGAASATIDVASVLAGSTFEGVGSRISMTRANGRQAVAEAVYGTVRRRTGSGEIELIEIMRFPPNAVNPPDGMAGLEWIERRFGSL